ncbi:ATP-binding protein [Mycobacterium sp. C31M]
MHRSAARGTGLALAVGADPPAANRLTQDLVRWLNSQRIDPARTSDISLAAYEALANCVDHAYRGAAGQMTLEATFSDRHEAIVVCGTDSGTWVEP